MNYIVAVSGGVDSVVLLDMLVKKGEHELIVAHFDHGIRPESDADARFVKALAEMYNLPFETKREELGKNASEELARDHRYAFLRSVAKKHSAKIVTAHHSDDVLETIAINLQRGTGWRGLAVLDREDIERPLLSMTKAEIYEYALTHQLEWVEDETNASDEYLRNRIRRVVHSTLSTEAKLKLVEFRSKQLDQKKAIEVETKKLTEEYGASRYFFSHIDEASALDLLRALLLKNMASLTRPQRRRLLHAIKTMRPGGTYEAGNGITVNFTKRDFVVKQQ